MKTRAKQSSRLGFGWVPDLPDNRDHLYAAPMAKLGPLPRKVDLRKHCPPVYNQGQIGSCTANAIAAAIEFDRKKQKLADFIPSRLFIYYNERSMEHSVPIDNGAQIRDGIKSVGKQGACPEPEWPYDDTPADPTTNLWAAGAKPCSRWATTTKRNASPCAIRGARGGAKEVTSRCLILIYSRKIFRTISGPSAWCIKSNGRLTTNVREKRSTFLTKTLSKVAE